jgi:hypothetical protein
VKEDREEVEKELTINTAPRSTMSSYTPVLQIYSVVEFASLNRVCETTALGTADAEVGL